MGNKTLWQYSHAATIFSAVLLFTAGFLCLLLWTNNIVHTPTSQTNPALTSISPAVSTFRITYNVAIFGTTWNAILFVALIVLEREALPIKTPRLRYEIEKAAIIVSVVGNAIYGIACFALMSTLARLAADAYAPYLNPNNDPMVAASAKARRAGQGMTAAMAGLAAATAIWSCFIDVRHAQHSPHRRIVKDEPMTDKIEVEKQA